MEFGLRKYSEIALILYDLLDGNYECTRLFIDRLKNDEIDDSRKYHIERYIFRIPILNSYSFVWSYRSALYRFMVRSSMDDEKDKRTLSQIQKDIKKQISIVD